MSDLVDHDARDLAAAKAGDEMAVARLYDRHSPVVLSLCRLSVGRSLAEAEDAAQETFIRAYQRLHKLDGAVNLRPWLYAIARRVCSERRRAASRRGKHEGRAMLSGPVANQSAPGASETAQRGEELDRLTAAIEQLGERERLAIHLYYLDSDPVRAAASSLGLSRSGYYKLLARARAQLADLMQEVQPS